MGVKTVLCVFGTVAKFFAGRWKQLFSFVSISVCALVITSCTKTNNNTLSDLAGFVSPTTDVTVNGPLGNSALTFTPSSLPFGNVPSNTTSSAQTLTLNNASPYDLLLGATTGTAPEFTVSASTCTNGSTLAVGASCTISLQFAPTAGGSFNSVVSVSYSSSQSPGPFSSNVGVSGTGVTLSGFAGLASLNNITAGKMQLNWTGVAGADSYQIYNIVGATPILVTSVPSTSVCTGTVCNYTMTGLLPNTSYTYRVRATDLSLIQETNNINRTASTGSAGTFNAIANLAASEGSNSQSAVLSCADMYASPNSFAITAQSDVHSNCVLTATTGATVKLSCSPGYEAAGGVHSSWSSNVTVACTINDVVLTQSLAVNVTNTNRAPAIVLSSVSQTVWAQSAIAAVTAKDTNTNGVTDIDGDTITFSCTFAGGGFGAGTNCTSLPADSFSMNSATGVLNWTPSLAAAVGGNATTYSVSFSGSDGHGGNSSTSLNIIVNPGLNLSLPAGNITSTSIGLSWTKITGAASYLIYQLSPLTPIGTMASAACGAGPCTFTATGLTAATAYTYRVIALDAGGASYSTSLNQTATTKSIGSFTAIGSLGVAEGATAQTASMSCTDAYANSNLFAITAQTDPASNCTLTATTGAAAKVTCSPSYKAAGGVHSAWSSNVTVQCTINGSIFSRTFAVNVSNANRNPAIVLSSNTAQTISAQFAIAQVTARDSNTNSVTDIDGDTITFSCTFAGGGFGAGTNCTSLPAAAYTMNSATGAMNWTPSLAAAVGGNATTYTISLVGNDGNGGTNSAPFNVTVNPGPALTIPGGSITSTSMQLSWTKLTGAASYIVYQLAPTTPLATVLQAACGAGPCTYTVSGLTAGTGYSFHVVALDNTSAVFSTSLDVLGTTSGLGTFSAISTLAASEGSLAQTASMSCTDGSHTNLFSVLSQSDPAVNCSLSATTGAAAKVNCTPNYKAAGGVHSAWSSNVTIQCALNGTNYNQTFAVNVANTNRNPAIVLSSAAGQTINAQFPINPITASDSNTSGTTDIDGDTITFSCTFSGGGFGAGTNCTSLPANSYSMNSATGVLAWTPSLLAAVANAPTTYTISLKGDDGHSGNTSAAFNVTVNPTAPVLTTLVGRTWPSTTLLQGGTVNYDVNNISVSSPGNDTGMTYACTYDQVVDGAVAAGTACTSLPGTVSFNTATGVFSWTPNTSAIGQYEIRFRGTDAAAQAANSIVVVDVRLSFGGISSITNVTTTGATVNWTVPTGSTSAYYVYTVDAAGNLSNVLTVNSGAATSGVVTGLTPATTYSLRARAVDSLGNTDPNTINQSVTTKALDTFTTGTLTVAEGATNTLDLSAKCTDTFGTGTRAYGFTSQTSANASPNCSVIGTNLSCTPPYLNKSGTHANWSETATVTCTVDGSVLSQTMTVNVTGATQYPTAAASTATGSPTTLAADGVATSTITVTLKDGGAVKSPGRIVTLTSSRGASDTISAASGPSDVNGVVTFTVKSTTSGTATFTAVDSSENITVTQQPVLTYTVGPADHLVKVAGDAQSTQVNLAASTNPKVQVVDRYGNAVSGINLSFIPSRGSGVLSSYKVTSDASGNALTTYYAGATDTKNFIDVRPMGTPFPDLAGSGNAKVQFSETSTNLGNGTFSDPQYALLGGTNGGIVTADINGDGKKDVIMTGVKMGVFLGNADGTFQARVDYTTGTSPWGLAAADLNNDGILDMVVANFSSASISVMIGNGNGTFKPKVDYAASSGPLGVVIGDFDGDGANDIAVTNATSATVSVFMGLKTTGVANGTFGAKTDFTVGANARGIVAKDFNADGKLDLAVVNYNVASMSILMGNGNGTFAAKVDYTTGTQPTTLVAADVNADGKQDLVVANSGSASVSVFLGNGNGTFQAKVDYAALAPWALVLKDLDGDGALDIVATGYQNYTFGVLMGHKTTGVADGTFNAVVNYAAGFQPMGIAVDDVNGDGKFDAVLLDNASTLMSVKKGNGDGTFRNYVQNSYPTGTQPNSVITGDFNADGKLDLAVANASSASVSIFIGNGNGIFQAKVDYTTGTNPYTVSMGDFNEDGALDLAITNYVSGTVSILLGHKTAGVADGTFNAKVDYIVGSYPRGLSALDFNNDGHLDLVAVNYGSANLSVLTGAGDGTFTVSPTSIPVTGTAPLLSVAGDLNGDGNQDLIVTNLNSNTASVFIGNGNGTFKAKVDNTTGLSPWQPALGDFNEDSKLDYISPNYSGQNFNLFTGNGNGTFLLTLTTAVTTADPVGVNVADFNGDGHLDFAMLEYIAGRVDIFIGNGNGTFQSRVSYNTDRGPINMAVGDFNGDGKLDMAIVNALSNTVNINLGK